MEAAEEAAAGTESDSPGSHADDAEVHVAAKAKGKRNHFDGKTTIINLATACTRVTELANMAVAWLAKRMGLKMCHDGAKVSYLQICVYTGYEPGTRGKNRPIGHRCGGPALEEGDKGVQQGCKGQWESAGWQCMVTLVGLQTG